MLPLFLLEICDQDQIEDVTAFYEKYWGDLLRYAKTQLGNKSAGIDHEAEDVLQNAFFKVLKNRLLDFSKGELAVKAYMRATIDSVIKDTFRKSKVFYTLEEDSSAAMSDEDFFEELKIKERYNIVISEIEKMEPIYSYVIMMKMNGHKPQYIAQYMHIPVNTVYTRLKRGKKMLLEKLKSLGAWDEL